MLKANFELMAKYNQWINQKMINAAATLDAEELHLDRKAFFGSILGTLNHMIVGDLIWLGRFSQHPAQFKALEYVRNIEIPGALDEILHDSLESLTAARIKLDAAISNLCQELSDEALAQDLDFHNMKGIRHVNKFAPLLQHFFNHQTHHRGQLSTLLFQAGVDVGVTDLLHTIREG